MIRHLDVSDDQELTEAVSEFLLINVAVIGCAELIQVTQICLLVLIQR